MSKSYGCQSMVDSLRRVIVKKPDSTFNIENYKKWNYTGKPNLDVAQKEHDAFVNILKSEGVEVIYHQEYQPERADSIFTYDPAIVTDQGAIILRMGKLLRRGEEEPMARCLDEVGIPIIYRIHGNAKVEGGDCLW